MKQCIFLNGLVLSLISKFMVSASIEKGIHSRLPETLKRGLEILCPGVDICLDYEVVSAERVNQTKILDNSGLISCCRSCSCSRDCLYHMDCCFSDNIHEQVMTEEKRTLELIIGLNRTEQTISEKDNHGRTLSTNRNPLTKECLFVQAGASDLSWVANVESYSMVSRPPKAGCHSSSWSMDTHGQRLDSACSSDSVAPWGDLYPVYSHQYNTIYKNQFCARCHGVDDMDFWTPLLVCDQYEHNSGRFIAISEHFNSFENADFSGNCKIWFLYTNDEVLRQNRCFVDSIENCPVVSSLAEISVPSDLNMSLAELIDGCYSGLNAPVKIWGKVYRNVFCAVCNSVVPNSSVLLCPRDGLRDLRSFGEYKMTYLLDGAIVTKNFLNKTLERSNPRACRLLNSDLIVESCRDIFCPSGQIRSIEGKCEYPSREVYTSPMTLFLKLDYIQPSYSILSLLNSKSATPDLILESFRRTSPWPSYWKIVGIFHVIDDLIHVNESNVIIELETETVHLDVVTKDLVHKITEVWRISISRQKFIFKQSYLNFNLKENADETLVPKWKLDSESINLNLGSPLEDSTKWTPIIKMKGKRYSTIDVSILLTCDQVELLSGEYLLSDKNLVLVNNLTNRIMFDREFELVKDSNGKVVPRVCLSTTSLIHFVPITNTGSNQKCIDFIFGITCLFLSQYFYFQ